MKKENKNLVKCKIWNYLIIIFLELSELILSLLLIDCIANVSDYLLDKMYNKFIQLLPVLFITIIAEVMVFYIRRRFITYINDKTQYEMQSKIYTKMLNIQYKYKTFIKQENIFSMYKDKIELICGYQCMILENMIAPITFVVAIIYFATIHLKLLIISILVIPTSSFLYNKLSTPILVNSKHILDDKKKLIGIAKDIICGFYIVKSYNIVQFFSEKYMEESNKLFQNEKERDKIDSFLGRLFIVIRYIPQLVIPLYGGYLTYKAEMTVGELIAVNTIIWYIINPVEAVLSVIKQRKFVLPAIVSINDSNRTGEIEYIDFVEQNNTDFLLQIQHLSFSYETTNIILKDINLQILKNQKIGIIGASGAGKSTLIKILCGFLCNYSGEIFVNGINFNEQNSANLQYVISYMPQSPHCFHGTIYENIVMGKTIEMEKVIYASKLSYSYDFIMSFPKGFDTVIGSGGVQLSGGQMKRLCLTRIFLESKKIVLLDEPTASLDSENASKVIDSIESMFSDRAILISTHDFNLIKRLDKVYRLDNGGLNEVQK